MILSINSSQSHPYPNTHTNKKHRQKTGIQVNRIVLGVKNKDKILLEQKTCHKITMDTAVNREKERLQHNKVSTWSSSFTSGHSR